MSISVFVICDHLLFRDGITGLLHKEPGIRVLGESALSMDTADLIDKRKADTILLTVGSCDAGGLAAQRLYRNLTLIPVVVLLMDDDSDNTLSALRLGARGILDRNTDGNGLVAAIQQAANGEITIPSRLATRLVSDYAAIAAGKLSPPHKPDLSDRELEVLALLAQGQSNREIAALLCVSVHTVRAHLRSVMQKLGVKNRVQAATYAVSGRIGTPASTTLRPISVRAGAAPR